jgi:hypothetical protein
MFVPPASHMRYFFRKHIPAPERILLVESGSRFLFENLLPGFYSTPETRRIDLVTCFAGSPNGFRNDMGKIYRVADFAGKEGRARLYDELKRNQYTTIGIICSGEPLMTKWKWMLAARVPAKLLIVNENSDYFWVDYSNWRTIRHFFLYRAGLSGAEAVPTLARLALFPFTLLYLVIYAAAVHLRRRVHT